MVNEISLVKDKESAEDIFKKLLQENTSYSELRETLNSILHLNEDIDIKREVRKAFFNICLANQFLNSCDKFWFIDKYFPNQLLVLTEMAKDNKGEDLYNALQKIWYYLPNSFNIIDMPKGYGEFLDLIEM
jgi:hypothetical protein